MRTFVQWLPLSPESPVPFLARAVGLTVYIAFDRPLREGPIVAIHWRARLANVIYFGQVAWCTMSVVVVELNPAGFGAVGPDEVAYLPPPFDVWPKVAIEPAQGFVAFPIT